MPNKYSIKENTKWIKKSMLDRMLDRFSLKIFYLGLLLCHIFHVDFMFDFSKINQFLGFPCLGAFEIEKREKVNR